MEEQNFTCKRCGYQSSRKSDLKKHLQRVNTCAVVHQDIAIDVLLNEIERKIKEKKYKCDQCNKKFTSPQGKYIHKKACKGKGANVSTEASINDSLTQLKNENKTLLNELKSLKDTVQHLVNDKKDIKQTFY